MNRPQFTCPHCRIRGDAWQLDGVTLHTAGMSYPGRLCLHCLRVVRVMGRERALP